MTCWPPAAPPRGSARARACRAADAGRHRPSVPSGAIAGVTSPGRYFRTGRWSVVDPDGVDRGDVDGTPAAGPKRPLRAAVAVVIAESSDIPVPGLVVVYPPRPVLVAEVVAAVVVVLVLRCVVVPACGGVHARVVIRASVSVGYAEQWHRDLFVRGAEGRAGHRSGSHRPCLRHRFSRC